MKITRYTFGNGYFTWQLYPTAG